MRRSRIRTLNETKPLDVRLSTIAKILESTVAVTWQVQFYGIFKCFQVSSHAVDLRGNIDRTSHGAGNRRRTSGPEGARCQMSFIFECIPCCAFGLRRVFTHPGQSERLSRLLQSNRDK